MGDYVVELKNNFEIRDSFGALNHNLDQLESECN